jgi:hypothetical protein
MVLIDPSFGRPLKKQQERGVEVRSVMPRELANQLRMMAARENCTLSDLVARLVARVVEKK